MKPQGWIEEAVYNAAWYVGSVILDRPSWMDEASDDDVLERLAGDALHAFREEQKTNG